MRINSKKSNRLTGVAYAALTLTSQLMAQSTGTHHIYKLVDSGTLGGPNTIFPGTTSLAGGHAVNKHGAFAGGSATTAPDAYKPCWLDCYLDHAIISQNGKITDLGALSDGNSSAVFSLNDKGMAVGTAQTGAKDALTGSPAYDAVVWVDGVMNDLGGFGGSFTQAIDVNNAGQVVGVSATATPDQYARPLGPRLNWAPVGSQQRAFLWEGTGLQDLGTLGGNDAAANLINQQGQIVGVSYTNNTPNAATGIPTQDPFFWDRGKMTDVGTLGGNYGYGTALNNKGQVVGQSNIAGDKLYHAFFWSGGVLTDIGTFGGPLSSAYALNENGQAVGFALLKDGQTAHAFIYDSNAKSITDLGASPAFANSVAYGINKHRQVVGILSTAPNTTPNAALWENGGPAADLNQLLDAPTTLHLVQPVAITDSGEIVVVAITPAGAVHSVLMVPNGYCDAACEAALNTNAAAQKGGN